MLRALLVSAVLGLACASAVAAGEPTERLRSLFGAANRLLLTPDPDAALEDRLTAIRALVDEVFDARAAAALALGPEWDTRTPAERDEFVRLYADLVERAYLGWIGSRARLHGDGVRITFESESLHGDRAVVLTTLQTRGAGEVPIDYRMRRRDGRWVVDDVVVDGLSLADSYRAQIHRVLRDGSYADVLARLRDHASPATLIAIARSKRSATAALGSSPLPPLVGGAAATAPLPPSTLPVPPPAPPVRIASTAPASDAPLLGSRVVPAVAAVAPAVAIGPPPARPATASIAPPGAPLHPPAVATAPAPTPPAVVRSAPRWFWIQVGAFRGTDAASRLVERLRRHPVTVATGTSRSGPLARVLVGPFTSRAAAAPALRELAAAGYRAFIATE